MSPHGCQKMSAKPCKRDAEESLPVRSLSNRKPKPPNCLLIQDKTFYSLDGTLVVTSEESPNHDGMRLQGVRGGNVLEDLEVPGKYTYVLEAMPRGAPYNVGQ